MDTIPTARDVIAAFGGRRALADATGARMDTVKKWDHRNSIPPTYDRAIVEAASAEGLPITYETLATIRSTPERSGPDGKATDTQGAAA